MAYTQDQINSLNKINESFQSKYWANATQEFNKYVTQNYWADKVTEIRNNLQQNIQQNNENSVPKVNNDTNNTQFINEQQKWQWKIPDYNQSQKLENPNPQTTPILNNQWNSISLPQTNAPNTIPKVDNVTNVIEKPKYQTTIDKALNETTIWDVRDRLKNALNNWQISQDDYNKSENYLISKLNEKEDSNFQQNQNVKQQNQNPNVIYSEIQNWNQVDNELFWTPEYNNALIRANNLATFENLSANDLATAINIWMLLPWTQTYNDLKAKNPTLLQQAEQLNTLNSSISTKKTTLEDTLTQITSNILKSFTWDVNNYKKVLSENPQVVKLNTDMATKKKDLDVLKDEIDNAYTDIEDQFKWSGKTKWYIRAKAWLVSESLIRQYNLGLNEYNTMAWQLQTITENVKYEMELKTQAESKQLAALEFAYWVTNDQLNYQRSLESEQRTRQYQLQDTISQRQYEATKTAEQRNYEKTLTDDQRKYNEELVTRQLEQQYKYNYWDINSNNPTLQNIAIQKAVTDMYTRYPIPGMESQASKVQKIKDLISSGLSGSQAIAQVEQEIRNSDRYKSYLSNEQSKANWNNFLTFNWNLYKTDNSWNISLALKWESTFKYKELWTDLYQDWEGNTFTGAELAQQKLLNNKYLNANIWTQTDVECWQFARTATWLLSTPGGNSLSSRIEAFSDTSPTPGWLVLFNWWNYNKTYWHISVVTWINSDWTITVKESNLNNDKKVTERKISLNDPNISWFYNNTPLAWWWQEQETSFNSTDIRAFNDLTPSEKTKKQKDPKFQSFVESQNKIYNNPDANLDDILSYSAWGKDLWETSIQQLSKFNQALSQVSELSKKISTENTWPIVWLIRQYNPYDANAQALKAEINSLVPNIARWVYWEVWVLTDNDIEQYKKTLPNITSIKDTNNLVLAMTLKTMMNGYKSQLQTLASAWKDVSGFSWQYKQYENTITTLLNDVGRLSIDWNSMAGRIKMNSWVWTTSSPWRIK